MNWIATDKIIKNQPKAWEKWLNWYPSDDGFSVLRNLYDFFDEQGIFIMIFLHSEKFKIGDKAWLYCIENKRSSKRHYKFRKEAEQAAFEKAFEILEKKLNE